MIRLSKQMASILQLLAKTRSDFSMEKAKEKTIGFRRLVGDTKKVLGQATPTEEFEPSEEEITQEFFSWISMRPKQMIVELESEVKRNYDRMVDNFCVDSYEASDEAMKKAEFVYGLRFNVSLPELIMGDLFPKGRVSSYCYRPHVEGYEEALKTANKLMASYCRTLSRLVAIGLVDVMIGSHRDRSFYITDKGLSVLNARMNA